MTEGKSRYLIALIPPEPMLSEIREIKNDFHEFYGSKGALRSPAHITLQMPFLWKQEKEGRLINLLVHATKEKEFEIKLNGFGCFSPKTIFIKNDPSQALSDFQKRLTLYTKRAMNLFNATHNKGFHPHITVAFRDLKKDQFELAWQVFQHKSFEATFNVKSFWLLKHEGKKWKAYREFPFTE